MFNSNKSQHGYREFYSESNLFLQTNCIVTVVKKLQRSCLDLDKSLISLEVSLKLKDTFKCDIKAKLHLFMSINKPLMS